MTTRDSKEEVITMMKRHGKLQEDLTSYCHLAPTTLLLYGDAWLVPGAFLPSVCALRAIPQNTCGSTDLSHHRPPPHGAHTTASAQHEEKILHLVWAPFAARASAVPSFAFFGILIYASATTSYGSADARHVPAPVRELTWLP